MAMHKVGAVHTWALCTQAALKKRPNRCPGSSACTCRCGWGVDGVWMGCVSGQEDGVCEWLPKVEVSPPRTVVHVPTGDRQEALVMMTYLIAQVYPVLDKSI